MLLRMIIIFYHSILIVSYFSPVNFEFWFEFLNFKLHVISRTWKRTKYSTRCKGRKMKGQGTTNYSDLSFFTSWSDVCCIS